MIPVRTLQSASRTEVSRPLCHGRVPLTPGRTDLVHCGNEFRNSFRVFVELCGSLVLSCLLTVLGHLKSKEPGAPMAFALQETHGTIAGGISVGVVEGCVIIRAAEEVQLT